MNALCIMHRLEEIKTLLGDVSIEKTKAKALVREEATLRTVLVHTYCMDRDRISVVEELYHKLTGKLGLGVTWTGNHLAVRWVTHNEDLKRGIHDLVQVNMVITGVEIPSDDEQQEADIESMIHVHCRKCNKEIMSDDDDGKNGMCKACAEGE
jgi:hypothetical protein